MRVGERIRQDNRTYEVIMVDVSTIPQYASLQELGTDSPQRRYAAMYRSAGEVVWLEERPPRRPPDQQRLRTCFDEQLCAEAIFARNPEMAEGFDRVLRTYDAAKAHEAAKDAKTEDALAAPAVTVSP